MRALPPLATRDRVIDAVLVVSCGVAQAVALAIAAFATRDAFAALHGGGHLAPRTMVELGVAGAVTALCLFFARRRAEALGQSYAIDLRHALYTQIARLPKARHAERRLGALSLRFVGDLSAARLWFGRGLPDVLSALVVLPGAVAILFALDPALARLGLVPLALALTVMVAVAWHLERRHKRLRQRRASLAIAMIERIAIAPELDLIGRTDKELRDLDAQGAALRQDAIARRSRTAGLQGILQGGVALSGLAMIWTASVSTVSPATVAASLSVLALVAMPLQDLAAAWDQFCAWRVARAKALRLLSEEGLERRGKVKGAGVSIRFQGLVLGAEAAGAIEAGDAVTLAGRQAHTLARLIAGLDRCKGLEILYDGQTTRPKLAFVGDAHVGLQGSLRRSATLMCRKRPKDAEILRVLDAFGLAQLTEGPEGLDRRLAANGTDLTCAQSLRLDLARAVLGQADVIVISSLRWASDPGRRDLLDTLRAQSPATVVLAESSNTAISLQSSKVS